MSVESFQELPIEQLGGICTCVDPADVPIGMSTYCQDVEFYPGGVRTRPGALAAYDAIGAAGTARVLGLKSHVTLALTQKLLVYDSEGNLRAATPGNPLVLLR